MVALPVLCSCVALPMMLVVLAGVWDSPAAVCFSDDGSMGGARLR